MGEKLYDFYKQNCLKHVEAALKRAVDQPASVVTDEARFEQIVVEPGWNTLPAAIRAAGREALRWDDLLLALRKEVFQSLQGRIILRDDASSKVLSMLITLFGKRRLEAEPPKAVPILDPPKAIPIVEEPLLELEPPSPPQAVPVPMPPPLATPISRPPRATPTSPPTIQTAQTQHDRPKTSGLKTKNIAIGIDLGTTYSVIAYVDPHGRPTTIHNGAGDLTTPSVILMDENGPIVGKEAVLAAPMEPDKIASCVKRDIGARTFHKRIANQNYPPEVLSSMILRALKEDAARKLGSVNKAVVTVPAYFDEARRRATLDAGRLAGLDVLGIINEPTGAALAYGYELGFLDKTAKVVGRKPLRVLVYDLGGGTFDVTIVHIEGRAFRALATDGDVRLGGKDWDEILVEMAAERAAKQLGEDPRHNPNTREELWQTAEIAKKTLTERDKATMYINHAGARCKVEITRAEFEDATASLLSRTRTTTEIVVRQAGMKWSDIDKVLLVGGSTRMPMVVHMLKELTGHTPEQSISPDEAVAHGAALYAKVLLQVRNKSAATTDFSITNVNSHSLGLVGIDKTTGRKRNQILIPKNTPLPHAVTGTFKTHQSNQPNVMIRIVEGESERPEACTQIGTCKIAPLPPGLPAGWPIVVKYAYLADGQIRVSAQVKGQGKAITAVFQRENNMADEEISKWDHFLAGMK